MTISEILKIEDANTGSINLFKEGIFWRVYQKSAYLFTKYIKELKVLKKFYKNVNREVVYAGFPDTILPKIQELAQSKGLKFEKSNDKHCNISGFEIDNDFEEWFQSLTLFQNTNKYDKIINKIRNYPVIGKTPLETQQFLIELQNEFND